MTRGGGGQNLIGTEQGELLDVLRTEELLQARALDGARSASPACATSASRRRRRDAGDLGSRAGAVGRRLGDPHLPARRDHRAFNELPPNHGHHTASAILAREAFAAAADATRFPEQLRNGVTVWQADRLLLNVPNWMEGPPPEGALPLDVGTYDARLGLGYADLAARSRSQHKSQGFGVAGERGPIIERFLPIAGTPPQKDILDGVALGWERFGPRRRR
jgi:hypothetical protein